MPSPVRSILNDPVSQHLHRGFARLHSDQTIQQALASIRYEPPTERVVYFYVTDDEGKLVGVVPTRRLLLSEPGANVAEVMIHPVIAIPESATVLEACEFFALHKLLAFPVVDAQKKIVGIVNIDLYSAERGDLDVRTDTADLFQLIGVHLSEAESAKVGLSVRRRFPWLLCNVAGGLIAGFLTDLYSGVSTLPIVTPFIPLVLAISESVAIQSVSLSINGLHSGRPGWSGFLPKIGRELGVGFLLGLGCGILVGSIAWLWKGSFLVGLSLFSGILGGVAMAAGVGLALPMLLKMLRRDPTLASGPMALALADMAALLLYFNLARLLLAGAG